MLPRAHPHPFPATRRLTLVVTTLLALHVILAWLALQAVFVELMWRVVAGRDEPRPLLATHVDQFRVLRLVQAGLWLVTAAAIRWVGRAQRNLLALGATGLAYAPWQAMAAFLVLGLNLIRPIAVLRGLCSICR